MPSPVQTWVTGTPITAGSLDIALYSCDGTNDNPNGILHHAYRPLLVESYVTATSLPTTSGGTQTSLAGSGNTTPGSVIYDTAGLYGQTQDQPAGTGYYQFLASIKGSAGDGQTPGGWMLLSHFAAIAHGANLTSISADLLGTAQPSVPGTRQPPSSTQDSTAFFLDLVNVGPSVTWTPAVTVAASSGTASLVVNATDSSGETCRFCALWAAVSATSAGAAFFPNSVGSPFPFICPQGVSSITVTPIGAGAGGGGGASGANEQGGGGGGGGEFASGTISTTGGSTYLVAVGAGGAGGIGAPGTGPGTSGSAGGLSEMVGDGGSQVVAHGGSGGGGATNAANGSGGAGGTGSSATTHHSGGAGANGKTAVYGGGGGSSAGTGAAGNSATSSSGAPAPSGGGPGGAGGQSNITVVQTVRYSATGNKITTPPFSALQAGNTVVCFVIYQGEGSNVTDPVVTLNDGTRLQNEASADNTSLLCPMTVTLYDAVSVSGGQTTITVTGNGASGAAACIQMYEVAGLGTNAQVDVSGTATNIPSRAHPNTSYPPGSTTSPVTTKAPAIWFGCAGVQQLSQITIYPPASSQGWTVIPQSSVSARATSPNNLGNVYSRIQTGYKTVTSTGSIQYSGKFSPSSASGWITVSFAAAATTPGNSPVIGPGGGGGAGLGAGNGGGAGQDGQVTLNWTAPSGSGYGTPALPSPFAAWTQATTLGTTSTASVNVNGPHGIRDVCNFLSSPPVFRIAQSAATPIPASAITTVPFTGINPTVDSYSGWSGSTYTVQRTGLYLAHGLACFANAATGLRMAAVKVNGTTYWGPPSAATSTGTCNVAKTQVLGLHAGDTVSFAAYQTTAGSVNLAATDATRFLLVYLCETGVPAGSWTPPDTTFRWASGTRGEALGGNLAGLFQQHLGNDLGFLVNRPYFTGYQTIAQTGLTQNAFTTVTLDQVQGIIHNADNGDNYDGWSAPGTWVAPEPGWYLCVGEVFASNPSTTGCTVTAALLPDTSGGATPSQAPDVYQQLVPPTTFGGGAALVTMQYLSLGESVSLQVRASGYTAPYQTIVGLRSGGFTNSALSLIWMSE